MQEEPANRIERSIQILLLVLILVVLTASILLARYNLRHGRGDSKGATRLAIFVFSAFMVVVGLTRQSRSYARRIWSVD
jgi:hypothetical protein